MTENRKRSYPLGNRRKDLPGEAERARRGQLSENRWAWCRTVHGQFVILVREDPEGETGRDIQFYHPRPGRPPFSLNLTSLTEQELLAFKDLVNSAIDWSMPIVRERDQEAADAFAAGDDSYSRIYRENAQLVYRKRPESEHSEGVQQRPEDAADVDRSDGDPNGPGLRAAGDEVAKRDKDRSSAEDNWPTPHQPPSLRTVGGVSGDTGGVQASDAG